VNPRTVKHAGLALAIYLAVFLVAYLEFPRRWLGASVDLLPALFVYVGTSCGLAATAGLAILGGVLHDSLSANPLGVSILPLFLVGAAVWSNKHNLLNEQRFAQVSLGLIASAAAPLISLFLLYVLGAQPLIGWISLWQWLAMALAGALMAPVWFGVFHRLDRALFYPAASESGFRPDRELDRGRS